MSAFVCSLKSEKQKFPTKAHIAHARVTIWCVVWSEWDWLDFPRNTHPTKTAICSVHRLLLYLVNFTRQKLTAKLSVMSSRYLPEPHRSNSGLARQLMVTWSTLQYWIGLIYHFINSRLSGFEMCHFWHICKWNDDWPRWTFVLNYIVKKKEGERMFCFHMIGFYTFNYNYFNYYLKGVFSAVKVWVL